MWGGGGSNVKASRHNWSKIKQKYPFFSLLSIHLNLQNILTHSLKKDPKYFVVYGAALAVSPPFVVQLTKVFILCRNWLVIWMNHMETEMVS